MPSYRVHAFLALPCLVVLFILVSGCGGNDPVCIGFSGQLTGMYADLGVAARNGAIFAVEDLNTEGGISGRPVKLLVEDDHNTREGAVKAANALLDQGAVGIVGHITSSQTVAALPVVSKRGSVMVSPTVSSSELSGLKDAFFRVQVATDHNARGLALFAANKVKVRRLAMLLDTGNQSYVQSFSQVFAATFAAQGGTITQRLTFDASGSPDWKQLLRSATDHGDAQALCVVAPAPATAMLAQYARLMGLDLPLFSSGLARTVVLLEEGGRAVEGLYMTNSVDTSKPAYKRFVDRYEERFGREALYASVRGYEAVMLLAAGLRQTGGETKGLQQALQRIDRIPGVDSLISMDAYGDCRRPSFILQIKEGRFVNVDGLPAEEGA